MENIIYLITLVVYSIFIIRFILSWIGADFDLDADLELSDVVSFKGLTHFLMGSSGWLSLRSWFDGQVLWYDWLIAFGLGIVFVIILYFVYKFLSNLESKPQILQGKDLIGMTGTVYLISTNNKYIISLNSGNGILELPAQSEKSYKVGDKVVILDYKNAYYLI